MQKKNTSKKEAVLLTKQSFPREALNIIDWATEIRNTWSSIKGYRYYSFLRCINSIINNRNLSAYISNKILPNIPKHTLPEISRGDIDVFISFIKKI